MTTRYSPATWHFLTRALRVLQTQQRPDTAGAFPVVVRPENMFYGKFIMLHKSSTTVLRTHLRNEVEGARMMLSVSMPL